MPSSGQVSRPTWAAQRLRFHLVLQQVRSFFQQTNVERSVANQVAVSARTSKCLKQHILIAAGSRSRRRGPQALQCGSRAIEFASGQVDGEKWQYQMKAVRVTRQQNEVIVVSQRRESGLTAFSHGSLRFEGRTAGWKAIPTPAVLLQICCNKRSKTNLVRLLLSRPPTQFFCSHSTLCEPSRRWQGNPPKKLGYNYCRAVEEGTE